MRTTTRFVGVAVALLAGACHEIPQDAHKSFAGKAERELYHSSRFGDDKARFEKTLDDRTRTQNECVRMSDCKSP